MKFIHVKSLTYPIDFAKITSEYPNTSFSYPPTDETISWTGYNIVENVEQPSATPFSFFEEGVPEKRGDKWFQKWDEVQKFESLVDAIEFALFHVDDFSNRNLVQDPYKLSEYQLVASEAKALLDGTIEESFVVNEWAEIKNLDVETAALQILSEDEAMKNKLLTLRTQRLKTKDAIRKAESIEELKVIISSYERFVSQYK